MIEFLAIIKAGGLTGGAAFAAVLILWKVQFSIEKQAKALTKVITDIDKRVVALEVRTEVKKDV
ncbi:hypothetical protein [Shewanella gelidii]|uniref:Uncharacterized protein n=1 Tax=Shewanella gelidii TaxID=1642821 RepID=A0A917NBA8_9GAMM|nr:hypothetical protein [Shewanella gelidii]MCL1098052.1 hypothetical protein [Shewanella gelidii]GGI85780.1 hypothetical protein GCM10009332_23840 [Shewanella gelidii]